MQFRATIAHDVRDDASNMPWVIVSSWSPAYRLAALGCRPRFLTDVRIGDFACTRVRIACDTLGGRLHAGVSGETTSGGCEDYDFKKNKYEHFGVANKIRCIIWVSRQNRVPFSLTLSKLIFAVLNPSSHGFLFMSLLL